MPTHLRPKGYIENYNPREATEKLLADVGSVLAEYRQYWPLTVRQVFYRLIGAYLYEKTELFYARLCDHMGNARRAKRIPFEAIRDDGIAILQPDHWANTDQFLATVHHMAANYERDRMADQDVYIEVWCEAAGMVHQLGRVAGRYSIPVYSSSGFDSLTAKHEMAQRIIRKRADGKHSAILHLGDFDPSGVSIFESVAADVRAFVNGSGWFGLAPQFVRVALSESQVLDYDLPTAPAKSSDSRSKKWDSETCQLEALAPDQIAAILDANINMWLDAKTLGLSVEQEKQDRIALAYALPAHED